jgi:hypothetical protein
VIRVPARPAKAAPASSLPAMTASCPPGSMGPKMEACVLFLEPAAEWKTDLVDKKCGIMPAASVGRLNH